MWQKKLEISLVPIWYKNGTIVCVFSLYLKLFAKIQKVLNIEKIFLKTYFGYKPPPGNPSLRDFWGEYRIRWRFFLRIANHERSKDS